MKLIKAILRIFTKTKAPEPALSYDAWLLRQGFTPEPQVSQRLLKVPREYYDSFGVYLRSAEWRALRHSALKRDKHLCRKCGAQAYHESISPFGVRLQVQFTDYSGIDTLSFSVNQLETICISCQDKLHQAKRSANA